jgi:hypothetical protein
MMVYGGRRNLDPANLNIYSRKRRDVNITLRPIYTIKNPLHPFGGWVVPRTGMNNFWRRDNLLQLPGFEPRTVQPVT